jgi:hypothetical protein
MKKIVSQPQAGMSSRSIDRVVKRLGLMNEEQPGVVLGAALKNLFIIATLASLTALALTPQPLCGAQSLPVVQTLPAISLAVLSAGENALENPEDGSSPTTFASSEAMPAAFDHYEVVPSATWSQAPFSRIGIGADVSPLGVGLKSAIVLNHYFDGRLMGNFFSYDSGRFEVEGFNIDAKIHMKSAAAALDWYPFGSVWRISPGVMFLNGNQVSATTNVAAGTSFSIEQRTYYSASVNPATGTTPITGTGTLGLHTHQPALTLTGGFGKFIPRSNRHWSFPSEFGVAFTGAPTVKVNLAGWACLDAKQTQCSNVSDPTSPIAVEFNNDLQTRLNSWRKTLNKVPIYPLFSYGVVYSFNIR